MSVSVLCPGPVKTNRASRAGKADSRMAKDPALIARIGYEGMQLGMLVKKEAAAPPRVIDSPKAGLSV